jgi:hypothetical protein
MSFDKYIQDFPEVYFHEIHEGSSDSEVDHIFNLGPVGFADIRDRIAEILVQFGDACPQTVHSVPALKEEYEQLSTTLESCTPEQWYEIPFGLYIVLKDLGGPVMTTDSLRRGESVPILAVYTTIEDDGWVTPNVVAKAQQVDAHFERTTNG